jgi:hypothetical protein
MRFDRVTRIVAILCCVLAAFGAPAVARQKSLKALFADLQEDQSTDEALRQFLKRSPNDPAVKRFLSRNLPQVLAAPPKSYENYINSIQLAGTFRVEATIPALIGEINCASAAGSTLHSNYVLDSLPCAKALFQIGDPAIPALSKVLADRSSKNAWLAYRALALIDSPRSLGVLRDYLAHDPNPEPKPEIEDALQRSAKPSSK